MDCLVKVAKEIEEMFTERVSQKTRGQEQFEYLIKWKNKIWTIHRGLQELRGIQWPTLLEGYTTVTSLTIKHFI